MNVNILPKNSCARKKMLALTAIMLGLGSMQVMAEDLETLGNTDKSSTYLAAQKRYTLAPNKTLSVTFTNYAGAANLNNFDIVVLPKDNVFDDSDINQCYLRFRADNWGDGPYFQASQRYSTWNWESFLVNLEGATVNLVIEREGATVKYRAVATTADKANTYEQDYRAYNVGDGEQDVDVILTIDHSYLVIDNDLTTITDTETATGHTIVGNRDNSTLWWNQFSDYYSISANGSLDLQFKNYTSKIGNYANWLLVLTNDVDRQIDGYAEYLVLRPDNYGWNPSYNTANNNTWYTSLTNWYDWANFTTDMEGSLVNMHISRSGAAVTVRADITTTTGATYYEEFVLDCGDGTQTIRAFLTSDHGHIDIDNSKTNAGQFNTALIGSYEWATYCSSHALDFSGVSGLEAYVITGHEGSTLTVSKVEGAVPAKTGLLLKGTANTAYDIPVVASASSVAANNLVACSEYDLNVGKEDAMTKYVLSVQGGKAVFQKINANSATVDRGKAYLQFTGDVTASALYLDFNGETTGIEDAVKSEELKVKSFYNLKGQRVSQPKKGLYIVNGKKIVID